MESLLWAIIGGLGSLVLLFGAGFIALWRSSFSSALRALAKSMDHLSSEFKRHTDEDREAHARYAVLAEKVLNMGIRVDGLHDWKNERGEPMVNKMQVFIDADRDRRDSRGRRDG